jgi:hypothetical protein
MQATIPSERALRWKIRAIPFVILIATQAGKDRSHGAQALICVWVVYFSVYLF